ncbi:N-acetylmuramoyl-L-alanine amidase [Clostridium sp. MB40-C1]|uniref:N-acetylmuramoyl-L-alanine amidase n=1 Tax=Clostridium sp. MB40-C1 TaxID=3070996 RepID=UPI0027DFE001|nr:N-acetylmuramoyl-L-alanine amidase [Clostridium sp. MB40-C1]WMJ80987.1 N-acetylmuramoyl-L-alanine amidase [Clostridium sp. MB40-C1]
MKIAVAAGHTLRGSGSGAVGFLNESVEVRKIAVKVADLLKSAAHEVLYLQIDKADSYKGENYKTRVQRANEWGANLYVEIHLNKTEGGYGSEIYTYNGSNLTKAVNVLSNLAELGFRNRGIKNQNLYVIKHTRCEAMLVECCFCDSPIDYKLYNPDLIAKAIAKGIAGQALSTSTTKAVNPKGKDKYTVNYCLEFQKWYNNITQTKAPISQDGIYGKNTEKALQTITNIMKEF